MTLCRLCGAPIAQCRPDSLHTGVAPELQSTADMTRKEWDSVHTVNGMAYAPIDGVLSDEYEDAAAAYRRATRAGISWKAKHYASLMATLRRRDIERAIDARREAE